MSRLPKTTKGRIILASACLALVAAVAAAVFLLRPRGEEFRTIVVKEITGTAFVSNDQQQDAPAYAGMALFSGDTLTVGIDSRLTIELDGDKYMIAEAGTKFSLEVSGKPGSDRTLIRLDNGAVLTRIKNKLGEEQSYVVKTPTSTIAVRGTVYYTQVKEDADGRIITKCDTFDGLVLITPIAPDGTPTEDPQLLSAGSTASITEIPADENDGKQSSAFVRDTEGLVQKDIDYNALPSEVIRDLIDFSNDGDMLDASKDQLEQYVEHTHTFSETWFSNSREHWHTATCQHQDLPSEIRADVAQHRFDDGAVTKQPTETAKGVKTFTCKDCGYAHEEEIPLLEHTHTWDTGWIFDETAHWHKNTCAHAVALRDSQENHTWDAGTVVTFATHTTTGTVCYSCKICGYTRTEELPKLAEHTFGAWKSDGNQHSRSCACGEVQTAAHTWNEGTVATPPTETAAGIRILNCTACAQTAAEEIPPLEHSHTWETGWSTDANGHWHQNTCTHHTPVRSEEAAHTWDAGIVSAEPSGAKAAVYTCTVCSYQKYEQIHEHTWTAWTFDGEDLNRHYHKCNCGKVEWADHTFDDWVSSADGHAKTCSVCMTCVITEMHAWDMGTVTKPATHLATGIRTFTCTVCGETADEVIAKLTDHIWSDWKADEHFTNYHNRTCPCGETENGAHSGGTATCVEQAQCKYCYAKYGALSQIHVYTGDWQVGESSHFRICTVCQTAVSTEAHSFSPWLSQSTDASRHYHFCTECGSIQTQEHIWNAGTETTAPTHITLGVKTFACTQCRYTRTEDIPKTEAHEWSKWTVDINAPNKHTRSCLCEAAETLDHVWDDGVLGTDPAGDPATIFTCTDCQHQRFELLLPSKSLSGTYAVDNAGYEQWYDASMALSQMSEPRRVYLLKDVRTAETAFSLPYENREWDTMEPVPKFYDLIFDMYGCYWEKGLTSLKVCEGASLTITGTGGGFLQTYGYGVYDPYYGGVLDGTITVKTGMYDFDPTEFVPDGYTVKMIMAPRFIYGTDWEGDTADYATVLAEFDGSYSALINSRGNSEGALYQLADSGLWVVYHNSFDPSTCSHEGYCYSYTVETNAEPIQYTYCSCCGENLDNWEHSHTLQWFGLEEYHEAYCTSCYEWVVEYEPHNLDSGVSGISPLGQTVTVYTCADCGYEIYKAHCDGVNHIYGEGVASDGGSGNSISTYTCILCQHQTTFEAHTCLANEGDLQHDRYAHWYACQTDGCPAMLDYESHSLSQNATISLPTLDTPGIVADQCWKCGWYDEDRITPYYFTDIYLVFDDACGQPGFDPDSQENTLLVSDTFDYTKVRVYGLTADSYDPESGQLLLTEGLPAYSRLLAPEEYRLYFYSSPSYNTDQNLLYCEAEKYLQQGRHMIRFVLNEEIPNSFDFRVFAEIRYAVYFHSEHQMDNRPIDSWYHEPYCTADGCTYTEYTVNHRPVTEEYTYLDAANHYQVCSCGHHILSAHEGNDSCTTEAPCTYCGESYTGPHYLLNNGTSYSYWNETHHWKQCESCGEHFQEGEHTGGTPAYSSQAQCSTCGHFYGPMLDIDAVAVPADNLLSIRMDSVSTNAATPEKVISQISFKVTGYNENRWIAIDPYADGVLQSQSEKHGLLYTAGNNLDAEAKRRIRRQLPALV